LQHNLPPSYAREETDSTEVEPMADLLVVTFANQEDAGRAREDLKKLQHSGGVSIQDMEVIEKDADGKIHHVGQTDSATKVGVFGGGALGLLIGLVFFPVLGLTIGAVAGGLIGKSLHHNIDKALITDVTNDLTPGTSAVFVLLEGSAAALVGAFEPYRGKIYQTSVNPELEDQLKEELSRGS
jgi:uncharacterized membrane protein